MKRIAFYGGSFDPVHIGHLLIAERLVELFGLDEFVFIPAFHAPHKPDRKPTSEYHRFAMLCLATQNARQLKVSTMELELREKQYTVDTLACLQDVLHDDEIFFVMGADSWADIRTWREWEKVLLMSNHIVVTRPGYKIDTSHVTEAIRSRMVDLRNRPEPRAVAGGRESEHGNISPSFDSASKNIFITDAVNLDVSATRIRELARERMTDWQKDLPIEVAKYIEKYQIY